MAGNRTIPRLWRDSVARNTGTAYLVDEGDTWREVSWADAAERVELLANGLLARGIRKGDPFGILARTTLEWALFDFALGHVGAIGVGIYANSSTRDVQYVLSHSEAVGVLCEDDAQRAKVEAGRAELPALRDVLTFADLAALEEAGRTYRAANPTALDDAIDAIDEEDLFTFIYTSGTTGPPKGCMTAATLAAVIRAGLENPNIRDAFVDSLAVAGRSGTLRARMPGLAGVVRGKTGTTDLACSLSGLVGDTIVFAVLQNGAPVAFWSARTAQDRFVLALARSLSRSAQG